MNSKLTTYGNRVTLRDGRVLAFQFPILDAVQFNDALIVCYSFDHFKKNDCNVFGYDKYGSLVWQVKPQKVIGYNNKNPYAGIRIEDDNTAGLINVRGWVIIVDPSTGEVMGKDWTK